MTIRAMATVIKTNKDNTSDDIDDTTNEPNRHSTHGGSATLDHRSSTNTRGIDIAKKKGDDTNDGNDGNI